MSKKQGAMRDFVKKCVSELTGHMSLIEIHSNHEITIGGCVGVKEYDGTNIVAETLSGRVKILGQHLLLEVFQGDILIISGRISSLFFEDYD